MGTGWRPGVRAVWRPGTRAVWRPWRLRGVRVRRFARQERRLLVFGPALRAARAVGPAGDAAPAGAAVRARGAAAGFQPVSRTCRGAPVERGGC